MIRSTASKVMWLGRATVFLVGLAVILALTVGVVSRATAHGGSVGLFHLGHSNAASALSSLVGTVSGGMLQVTNNSTATTAKGLGVANKSGGSPAVQATNTGGGPALGLSVGSGKAPMKVSLGAAKVANLDADKLDGQEASSFASSSHLHDDRYYTKADVDTALSGKASTTHAHDDRYYTEGEVDTALSGKANATHQHSGADITTGTVAEPRIDGTVTRDGEVMPIVKDNDGPGSNLAADNLDGLDSLDFVQGRGEVTYNRDEPPRDWTYRTILEVPGFGKVGAACHPTAGNYIGFDNTSGGELTMFKDDGGADPSYRVIASNSPNTILLNETGSELMILHLSRGTGLNTRLATIALASHYDSNICVFEGQAIAHSS